MKLATRPLLVLSVLVLLASGPAGIRAGDGDDLVLRVFPVQDLLDRGLEITQLAERAGLRVGADGSVEAETEQGVLIVRADPEGQRGVAAWLREIRAGEPGTPGVRLVTVSARFLRSRRPLLPAKDGDPAILAPEKAARLLEAIEGREDVQVVTAPRITGRDREHAEIRVEKQISYIGDFVEQTVAQGQFVADPQVETVAEGIRMDVRPLLHRDGAVSLLLEVTATGVARPIPKLRVPAEGGRVLEIQTPRITRTTSTRAVTLRDGASALLDLGLLPESDGDRISVLIGAAPFSLPDEEEEGR